MRPIGVFDSGVGGLTVVAALRRRLPDESIVYLGDTARLPYGTKSRATVVRYTRRNIGFLLDRGVKGIVVACHTGSALALDELDTQIPTWGVSEPGADEAARRSAGRIGILATESTIRSGAYREALLARRPDLDIVSQACPLFVPLVEVGWHDDPITVEIARRYLRPLIESGVDTLVLGCTHYPLLAPVIESVVGPDVELIDSAEAVAEMVAKDLADRGLAAEPGPTEHHLCVTDATIRFQDLANHILGPDAGVSLELVELPQSD